MGSAGEETETAGSSLEELKAIVPARAVLTELARGFLLVHESNPDRAVRFAETFLRERSEAAEPSRVETNRPVSRAQLRLGLTSRGAVEPTSFPPVR